MVARRRWKLTLAYDGTNFMGWERQAQGERTVQGVLEEAITGLTREEVAVIGASRTDSGVHALGQVACADLPPRWEAPVLLRGLNALTPKDLRVVDVRETPGDFHPRYAARGKTYFYNLIQGSFADPFRDRYAHRLKGLPSPMEMRLAGNLLRGERDFSAMMAAGSSVKTTRRRLFAVRIRSGRDWLRVFFTAEGFLYKMARNMVSLMTYVALGEIAPEAAQRILASGDRGLAPPTFPAKGLFLWRIDY